MHPVDGMGSRMARGRQQARPSGDGVGLDPYLQRVGERLRNARNRRGMARKDLARESGVSERYLAQLEAGQGNVSILLMRRIAGALAVPLPALVQDGPDRPVEHRLIEQWLDALAPAALAETYQLLQARFGPVLGRGAAGRIALVGLRGAGKTTLGKQLATRLQLPFLDMGDEIERESGMSLSEIFSLSGQGTYRRLERRCLERLVAEHDRAVIETGGSLVSEPATYELLLQACRTVWIRTSPEEHMGRVVRQGDLRPMAASTEAMEDLRRMLAEREPLYARADLTVDTAGRTERQSLQDLLGALPATLPGAAKRAG
jgi:XRE family transcriptional regulator, aerobic/anaerobic benzoate catabolism transcriptional regulator